MPHYRLHLVAEERMAELVITHRGQLGHERTALFHPSGEALQGGGRSTAR